MSLRTSHPVSGIVERTSPTRPRSAALPAAGRRSAQAGPVSGRKDVYLLGAICVFVIALMLFPIVMLVLGSIKPAAEASQSPPHYVPQALSFENYLKVFHYQAGLPIYLFNSLSVAFLTIALCLALAVPAGYG